MKKVVKNILQLKSLIIKMRRLIQAKV